MKELHHVVSESSQRVVSMIVYLKFVLDIPVKSLNRTPNPILGRQILFRLISSDEKDSCFVLFSRNYVWGRSVILFYTQKIIFF